MATFSYQARDAAGNAISGTLTADNQQAALRELDQRSLLPIDVRPTGEAVAAAGGFRLSRHVVSTRKLSMIYSQMADLLNAGVPILRTLEVLVRQNRRRAALAQVLDDVRSQVAGGQSLADAMARYPKVFPELHTAMVRAGERGGFIEDVLTRLAQFTERQDELRSKVVGSMAYPVFLISVGAIMVTLLMIFFVPRFAEFFDPQKMDLPASTQLLLKTSKFMQAHWFALFAGVGAVVTLCWAAVKSEAGRAWWDRRKLKLPLFGQIISLMAVARFCRILGTMLANGVQILVALRIAKDSMGNQTLAAIVEQAVDSVRAGEPLAVPLGRDNYFPADILDMIAVAEQSNTLDTVLINVADSTERRLGRSIDTMVRLLEPVLLLLVAGIVFAIAFSLLLPIFSLSTSGV
ncbi:MAG: type II secretion system F family protein [Phycisphaerae bacterium]|nr:type II secretion system F family protein [Phycisphaerae bacterium]